ncbi:hypothetical protein FA10DRAFT_80163 [Acaromyces ingoldii]|uniref:Uncharacterized protein n=1 Tax=Acaromyces ingoldii TaxID=215250 RepID=A0A316YSJ4_9BASI|nr:hypothetical protein FA10DRAFT_80163 [Acaromyces ingoldii]PWN91996.1 hypothetical protein FA10DRAFT_80163 [Acaromyces ingoldii]
MLEAQSRISEHTETVTPTSPTSDLCAHRIRTSEGVELDSLIGTESSDFWLDADHREVSLRGHARSCLWGRASQLLFCRFRKLRTRKIEDDAPGIVVKLRVKSRPPKMHQDGSFVLRRYGHGERKHISSRPYNSSSSEALLPSQDTVKDLVFGVKGDTCVCTLLFTQRQIKAFSPLCPSQARIQALARRSFTGHPLQILPGRDQIEESRLDTYYVLLASLNLEETVRHTCRCALHRQARWGDAEADARQTREADTQTSQQTDIFFSLGAHNPLASRRKRRGIRLAGALRFFACRQKRQGRHKRLKFCYLEIKNIRIQQLSKLKVFPLRLLTSH